MRIMKRIYLDNAAVTPVHKSVLKAMDRTAKTYYGNPSSIHEEGVRARKAYLESKRSIASFMGGNADDIVIVGSGTEANNLAIIGVAEARIAEGARYEDLHFVTTAIEHASVLECARYLEKKGVRVDYLNVDGRGIIDIEELRKKIKPNTFLVSVMYVNNEVGTIQPIGEIARMVRGVRKNNGAEFPYLHTDACQASLFLEINAQNLGADLITIDGQKMYGPRGIGVLWKRQNVPLLAVIHGGGQEKGGRSGTENVSAIVGLAKAAEYVNGKRQLEQRRVTALRDYFIDQLLSIKGVVVNGDRSERIANNVNISVPGKDNEFIVLNLDAQGVACSTKSSCLRDEGESYVIAALGKGTEIARSSIRFSLGYETHKRDIDRTVSLLKRLLA
jgi:cysteine desulfurase